MRKTTTLVLGLLCVAAGCSSSAKPSATPRSSPTTYASTGASPPTTLHFVAAPATGSTKPANPAATGTILMIKLYVGDLAKAQHFYSEVFGATPSLELGNTAHIMTFPKGGPGLVLLRAAPNDTTKQGSFIVKVPNLRTAKALALANGATEQGTFAGNPGGQSATSVDLLDPWGNQVEVLQLS